jgi:beta-galactosidase
MQIRGVAYYPEAWPPDRWAQDAALMAEAGLNAARLGEFAWACLEPRDGVFAFDWLQSVMATLGAHGIGAILATPTAAPPAWLVHQNPDVLRVDQQGHRARHGGRRHCCPTSPLLRSFTERLIDHLAARFASSPHVLGWQIDNEPSSLEPCYCDRCLACFRQWVRQRYGTIEAVNQAWGAVFWSGQLSDFEQIDPRCDRLPWQLAFRRFTDHLQASCVRQQAQRLRAAGVRQPITTNVWAGLNPGIDVGQLFTGLDAVGVDVYWNYYADRHYFGAQLDYMRHIAGARPLWVMETNAWNHDATADDGGAALWSWALGMFARGVEAMCYFRWRRSPMGEQHHPAVLEWSGQPGPPYRQVQSVCHQLRALAQQVGPLPLPRSRIAIVHDYDSALCAALEKLPGFERVARVHAQLNAMHLQADIVASDGAIEWSAYRLVILPQLQIIDAKLQERLASFVQQGGTLLAQTQPATRDRDGCYLTSPDAIGMAHVLGTTVIERCRVLARRPDKLELLDAGLDERSVRVVGQQPAPWQGCAVDHMERLADAGEVQTLAFYASGRFKGGAAVTRHDLGAGHAFHQGCWLDEASTRQLLQMVCAAAGLAVPSGLPPEVEVLKRGRLRFYLNHTDRPMRFTSLKVGRVVLGEARGSEIHLPPWSVCVVEEADADPD